MAAAPVCGGHGLGAIPLQSDNRAAWNQPQALHTRQLLSMVHKEPLTFPQDNPTVLVKSVTS